MTIDITGISNENEFYTHHYLSAILENDLKSVFAEWKRKEDEEGIKQPYKLLGALRQPYFSMRSGLEKARKIEDRLQLQREFISSLLQVLGYELAPTFIETDEGAMLPLIGGVRRADGSPELWIVEAIDIYGEDLDPFELSPFLEQYREKAEKKDLVEDLFEDIITKKIFSRSEPPRWVILVSSTQLLLLDRSKWHEKRILRFDLREIFDRKEASTLQATVALLHKYSVCPGDGMSLLDTLDENSHKHAFAVSEDLKYSLRESIELLGNEAVFYLREVRKEKVFGLDRAGDLSRECLRYMYRMLFLFYIEARPELGYLPTTSEEYRKGYSLESLRDLEMVPLTTEESRNGFYFHESISTLFKLLYDGFQPKQLDMYGDSIHHTFRMAPLRSHLFDPAKTPILNKVKFRNHVLQKIIELMSLSRPGKGRNTRRGRISYSQLGINQLGAVYEALLSYQGFFAETDLYEVKKAEDTHDVLNTAYFVKAEDLEQYTEDERVYNDNGTLMMYERGTFIYRLAGRDREKSASYYTPEVLTQCLVKYALKELLKDKTADDILQLTVCEPAMGSAAFLNEAVNQLARAYLDLKQKETGTTIPHEEYQQELQKVKMYIADNNVYGVDLNPVAVELAEVSLWLNTIYKGAYVPWFGTQLVCGNSLIGARRQVFSSRLLKKQQRDDALWLDELPERVMPGEERQENTVYHFLLPDKGMANYNDKVIKDLAGEQIKKINDWRRDFTEEFTEFEIGQLEKLSAAVDKQWRRHVEMQKDIDRRTTDPLQVFGQKEVDTLLRSTTTEAKDRIYNQEVLAKDVRNSSPYRRLKLVMDFWCALWFWPIEKADFLPSRAEFMLDLSLLLEGNLFDVEQAGPGGQLELFPDTRPKQISIDMVDEFGYVNVDKLCRDNERLGLVKELADRYRFHHWELHFASVFVGKGGFDLVLGNPPWIRVEWKEVAVLGTVDPSFFVKKNAPNKLNEIRNSTIKTHGLCIEYCDEYSSQTGLKNYLTSSLNYPLMKGQKANLYKCFLPLAWNINQRYGVSALLHPEGVYEDPSGGALRSEIYPRLRFHYQFQNELNLFGDVDHHTKFSINVFSFRQEEVNFANISNLFSPQSIDLCWGHSGVGLPSGVKDDNNQWNLSGHKNRILEISNSDLNLFSSLYDPEGTQPLESRFPAIHVSNLKRALEKFASHERRLSNLEGDCFSTGMWNETYCQEDGTLLSETRFPDNCSEWVVSGPHFYIGNPYNKTPKADCEKNSDYDCIDLEHISVNYLPRSKYRPSREELKFRKRTPIVDWTITETKLGRPITDFYRIVNREMIGSTAERTFVSAVIPKGPGNLKSCVATCFRSVLDLVDFAGMAFSLPIDFFVKSTGLGHANVSLINKLPLPIDETDLVISMRARVLSLICLTDFFSELWASSWSQEYKRTSWAKKDDRLNNNRFTALRKEWTAGFPLRTYFERRQALVEIDVLASMILGFSVSELCSIYRIQFPVMRQYEADTWYDKTGRIIFTCSKGLPGVGFPRKSSKTEPIGWEDIKDMQSGTVERTIIDDTQPGGPVERTIVYEAPFDHCDREKDYAVVWAEFERRFKKS